MVIVKLLIPLDNWSDSVECEWGLDKSYHSSMKLITLDMALASVLVVGKVIGGLKKGVNDIALISHVYVNYFNKMILFDVTRFAVRQKTYLIKIYNNSHPSYDSIWEDTSLYRNDHGVIYGLDDTIINDSEFGKTEKQSHHLSLKRRMRMKKIIHTG